MGTHLSLFPEIVKHSANKTVIPIIHTPEILSTPKCISSYCGLYDKVHISIQDYSNATPQAISPHTIGSGS